MLIYRQMITYINAGIIMFFVFLAGSNTISLKWAVILINVNLVAYVMGLLQGIKMEKNRHTPGKN